MTKIISNSVYKQSTVLKLIYKTFINSQAHSIARKNRKVFGEMRMSLFEDISVTRDNIKFFKLEGGMSEGQLMDL